uniref:Uncharacterized protein n=1 Tax=Micrurus spixii TaxID=129469 RepID=A0A2D4LUP3_9SAUR
MYFSNLSTGAGKSLCPVKLPKNRSPSIIKQKLFTCSHIREPKHIPIQEEQQKNTDNFFQSPPDGKCIFFFFSKHAPILAASLPKPGSYSTQNLANSGFSLEGNGQKMTKVWSPRLLLANRRCLRQSAFGGFTRGKKISTVAKTLQCAASFPVYFFAVRHGNGGEILQFVFLSWIFGTVPLGHDLVDLHEGFVLGFGDNEKDVDGGSQTDGAKNEEAVGAQPLLQVAEYQPHGEIRQPMHRTSNHEGSRARRLKKHFHYHNAWNWACANGVSHDVNDYAANADVGHPRDRLEIQRNG